MKIIRIVLFTAFVYLTGCTTAAPMKTVDSIDLPRFMGDWFVIASIPTFIERNAFNAVESYSLNTDGSIETVFTFNEGSFDGELKTYRPTGYVSDSNNALWGMQFLWPVKADYRIVYLSDDYTRTVIARKARDYVWIMARTPDLPASEYAALEKLVSKLGYDTSQLRRVPQLKTDDKTGEKS